MCNEISFTYVYYDVWVKALEHYGLFRYKVTSHHIAHPTSQQWVGLYRNQEGELLEWVVTACYCKEFGFGPIHFSGTFMSIFP